MKQLFNYLNHFPLTSFAQIGSFSIHLQTHNLDFSQQNSNIDVCQKNYLFFVSFPWSSIDSTGGIQMLADSV